MTDEAGVRSSFVEQATACDAMGSPLTARILRLSKAILQRGTPLGDRILNWQGDPKSDALALRLAGGLHSLVRSR